MSFAVCNPIVCICFLIIVPVSLNWEHLEFEQNMFLVKYYDWIVYSQSFYFSRQMHFNKVLIMSIFCVKLSNYVIIKILRKFIFLHISSYKMYHLNSLMASLKVLCIYNASLRVKTRYYYEYALFQMLFPVNTLLHELNISVMNNNWQVGVEVIVFAFGTGNLSFEAYSRSCMHSSY